MTPKAFPLLRAIWPRAVIAVGLALGHFATVALAFWLLVWLFAPVAFAVVVCVLVAALVTVKVMVAGRWSQGAAGAVEHGAVVVLLVAYVAVAAFAVGAGFDGLASQSTFATPRREAVLAFVLAALAAAASGVVLVAIPRRSSAGLVTIAAGVAAVAVVGGLGAAVAASASGDPCRAFEFDRSRWRAALAEGRMSEAERLARAIIRCDTIDGASRFKVRQLLGGSWSNRRTTWTWSLGMTNDLLGPGDGQDLHVRFDRRDRVRGVHLTLP
jgi:hypothetical protein